MVDVIRPTSEREAAEAVASAQAAGRRLEIVGGGSRAGLGAAATPDARLSAKLLLGVRLYEPGALTLIARAGTPMREIEQTLGAEGQQLSFEPMDHRALFGTADREPTIGGVVASGAAGPRRIQAGGARDSVIGVRFINGRGEVIRAGGRVMKNVTGYDLSKLMTGSLGALGMLTEVAFKLSPKPEMAATLRFGGLEDGRAVEALSAAFASPFDVTGAAHLPAEVAEGGVAATLIRLEGFEESVRYRARALAQALAGFGVAEILTDAARLWRRVRDAEPFAPGGDAVWRVSVKPTDGPVLARAVRAAAPARVFYDWGGGLVWIATPDAAGGDAGAAVIRRETTRLGGAATLVRASAATRARVAPFPQQSAGRAAMTEAVRRAFDPKGVFDCRGAAVAAA